MQGEWSWLTQIVMEEMYALSSARVDLGLNKKDALSSKGHVCEKVPGSGNWYAVIDTRDPATGKRKRKWHSSRSHREATGAD